MSTTEVNEFEQKHNKLVLKQITGKPQHITINERTLEAYRKAYADKGLVITKEEEYPKEDFRTVAKQKTFDTLVDAKQGIRKIIESMIRQPVTVFDKNGNPKVKDALYYYGYWYGTSKRGEDLGAPFLEGHYKKPKLSFSYRDAANPYDSKTGERRGEYKASGYTYEHYIFLSEDKKERRKQLEEIIQKATGTSTATLSLGRLHYRNPSADNNHSGTHGGSFSFDQFCDLSISELGECQQKGYYKQNGNLYDKDGNVMRYDDSKGKLQAIK